MKDIMELSIPEIESLIEGINSSNDTENNEKPLEGKDAILALRGAGMLK